MKAAKKDLALLQRFLRGECNENELPHARRVLGQLEAEQGLEPLLDELWEKDPLVLPAADLLYQRIAQALPPGAETLPTAPIAAPVAVLPWRRRLTTRQVAGMVAGVCLVLAAVVWAVQSRGPGAKSPAATAWLTATTSAGERKTVWLPDSSQVVLNGQSQLHYPAAFAAGHRDITLTGEAFFRITPDKARPFTVATHQLTATVLGTSFNVRAWPGLASTEVAVLTGRVAVAGKGQPATATLVLRAHEAARYAAAGGLRRSAFPDESALAWQAGEVVFRDTDFVEVVARLERFYGVSIRVLNGNITSKRYTGRFRHEQLANVLESLRYSLDFDYVIQDKQVTIRFK